MFVTIWRFTVPIDRVEDFERHYRAGGTWATLFRKAPGYIRTELLRDVDGPRYVTVDVWQSEAEYRAFREQHAAEYADLDRQCEALTTAEEHVGNIQSSSG